jgi:hypothetical protein
MRWLVVGKAMVVVILAGGCSSGGGSSGLPDAAAGSAGFAASGGSGGGGGSAGSAGAGGSAGDAGNAGSAGGGASGASGAAGTAGAPPMCSSSAECVEAQVSMPASSDPPTATPTDCVGGQCGLVTSYNGSYDSPKTPRSCTEICAASLYAGQPMKCSPSCSVQTINGFGDKGLFFGSDAGAGSVGALVRYQFSPISGAYKFVESACSEVPTKKLIQGSNSYTYVQHACCCVAP